jgi:predicted RNA-binding Zn-ribbon protein involved in translation (DUF1610 family)
MASQSANLRKGTTAMPVKYHCPKCGRRFVDWGAEKLGFKCPDCENEELVRAGVSEERPAKRSSLKRGSRKLAPVEPIVDESDFLEEPVLPDVESDVEEESEEEEEVFVPAEEEEAPGFVHSPTELITPADDEDEVDIDMPDDLNFGDVAPTLPDEAFEEAEDDTWHE